MGPLKIHFVGNLRKPCRILTSALLSYFILRWNPVVTNWNYFLFRMPWWRMNGEGSLRRSTLPQIFEKKNRIWTSELLSYIRSLKNSVAPEFHPLILGFQVSWFQNSLNPLATKWRHFYLGLNAMISAACLPTERMNGGGRSCRKSTKTLPFLDLGTSFLYPFK